MARYKVFELGKTSSPLSLLESQQEFGSNDIVEIGAGFYRILCVGTTSGPGSDTVDRLLIVRKRGEATEAV
jgi:hypothetical protein